MKTLIILFLIVVMGLAVIGAGPDTFIDNIGAGGMFLFSAVNSDSAFALLDIIKKDITPISETIEKGTFSLNKIPKIIDFNKSSVLHEW